MFVLFMLTALVLSPLYMLFVHSIFAKGRHTLSPQMACIASLLVSYLPALLIFSVLVIKSVNLGSAVSAATYFLLVYTCIAYSYFHVFNLSETARRVRLLHEILRSGSISSEKLLSLYQTEHIVKIRLKRLADMGQLQIIDGKYQVKGRALHTAALLIVKWRALLGFESA